MSSSGLAGGKIPLRYEGVLNSVVEQITKCSDLRRLTLAALVITVTLARGKNLLISPFQCPVRLGGTTTRVPPSPRSEESAMHTAVLP